MRKLFVIVVVSLVCALWPLPAGASKVSTWRQSTASDFRKGTLQRTVVTSEGQVRLSQKVDLLADLDAGFVWDLAGGEGGVVYAATADPGKVLRIDTQGQVQSLWSSADAQVFSIAVGPGGEVYAGTGPEGVIHKIAPDGAVTEFYKTGAEYIWDLKFDPQGQLLAATGPEGQIFRIDPSGHGQVFYDSDQDHVLCLALGNDGTVYAGTDQQGLVYRISAEGKPFVLYDAPQDEVRALLCTENGVVYAATAAAKTRVGTSSSSSQSDESSNLSSSSSSSSASVQSNSIYRIAPDGAVREIDKRAVLFFDLARRGTSLLAATGMTAELFALDEARSEQVQLVRVDHEQILSLLARSDGSVLFGTGGSGKLYRLCEGFCLEGTMTSEVFDAKMISRWGAIRWQADVPPGASFSLAVRAGNVEKPDETWSPWLAEMSDPSTASIACPASRFLQYRATLKTANESATPSLSRVSIRYATANQAPEITKVVVPHVDEADGATREQTVKFSWTASDPNNDSLRYELYFRKEDWKNWVELTDDLTQSSHEWDTTSVPEGIYTLRVVACDDADNPQGEALTAERTSEPFIVDHGAPDVALRATPAVPGTVAVEVLAEDRFTPIVQADYSVDSQPWEKIYPKDRLFDSRSESFFFELKDLAGGTHVLRVRVVDSAGNTGTADTVIEVP